MIQDKVALMSIADVVKKTLHLCNEGRTGKLYLMTDRNEPAMFVLNKGEVINVIYKNIRGTSALPMIRRIDSAKCFFKSGVEEAELANASLSFSNTLFRMFNLEQELNIAGESAIKNRGKKILVVEDSRLSRMILTKALNEHGFLVVEAVDGRSALEQLAEEAPDLVILDLILPDIDGYEVFNRMKESENTADIPVIILTSRASLVDKIKGKMSGSDEYITKPFKNEVLIKKLEKYLT